MRTPALWAAGTALFLSGTSSHALVTTESEVHRPDCEDLQTLTDWPWAEGFVTVCPRGLNYDIVFDFAQLHDWWELDVQGAKPWTITATPAGQVWRLSGDNSLRVSGHVLNAQNKQVRFQDVIARSLFDGLVSAETGRLQSAVLTYTGVSFTRVTEGQEIKTHYDELRQGFKTVGTRPNGRIDVTSDLDIENLSVQSSAGQQLSYAFAAEKAQARLDLGALPVSEVAAIIDFFVIHYSDASNARDELSAEWHMLWNAVFPLVSSLNAEGTLIGPSFQTTDRNGSAGSLGYRVAVNGKSQSMDIGLEISGRGLRFQGPPLPSGGSSLVPSSLTLDVSVPDLDFAAFGTAFANSDFEKLSNQQRSDKALKTLFSNRDPLIQLDNLSATSQFYQVEASGRLWQRRDRDGHYAGDFSILVAGYDETISAVQALAKVDVKLRDFSVALLVAKGFAKTDPDGSSRWDVHFDWDGSVTVNGQMVQPAN